MPLSQEIRNMMLYSAVISQAYALELPKSYPHDVAHTCVSIVTRKADARFVVGFRDMGCEYAEDAKRIDVYNGIFGGIRWFAFCVVENYWDGNKVEVQELTPEDAKDYLDGVTLEELVA